jgi:hypothetical protein
LTYYKAGVIMDLSSINKEYGWISYSKNYYRFKKM